MDEDVSVPDHRYQKGSAENRCIHSMMGKCLEDIHHLNEATRDHVTRGEMHFYMPDNSDLEASIGSVKSEQGSLLERVLQVRLDLESDKVLHSTHAQSVESELVVLKSELDGEKARNAVLEQTLSNLKDAVEQLEERERNHHQKQSMIWRDHRLTINQLSQDTTPLRAQVAGVSVRLASLDTRVRELYKERLEPVEQNHDQEPPVAKIHINMEDLTDSDDSDEEDGEIKEPVAKKRQADTHFLPFETPVDSRVDHI